MAEKGSLVSFVYNRRVVHALIVQWSGNPDALALLMDRTGQTYRRFVDACIASTEPLPNGDVLLQQDEAATLRQEIMDLVDSKRGKRRLEQSASDKVLALPQGRGVPEVTDIPLKVAEGMTSWPTKHMLWRMCVLPAYERHLTEMQRRYPAAWRVYIEHVHKGHRLVDVAHLLGITPAAARKRFERGRKALAEALESEQ